MTIKIKVQGLKYVEKMLKHKRKLLGGKTSVLVGYGGVQAPYAVYVHENEDPDINYTKVGTGPKFLSEAPFSVRELAEVVSQSLKQGFSLTEALVEAGQLVLERSEPQVPLDTTALVKTGFVEPESSND